MKSFSIKFLYSLTCAALLLALVGVQPAYAASYVVNTLTDENTSGDGLCSLREAIASANNSGNGDCGANSASADTITFNSGLSGGTITLSSSLPAINFDLTIDGSSLASQITISGANSYQITNVDPGVHATLDSLIFAHGNAPTGGGIFNEGILTINNSIFSDNRATGGNGGAIYNNSGTLTITGSTFSGNNHAETDGGALYINVGTVTISNSTFSSNTALNAAGGVYNAGTLTINNSTFSGNSAYDGGGLYNSGTLTISNSTFSGNTAVSGGGLYNSGGTLTATDSAFRNNSATVTGGQFVQGGAIFNINGSLTLNNSTFNGNSATITTTSFVASASGGAINNYSSAALTITNSTFFGNSVSAATSGSGASAEALGGGIYNGNTLLTIRNSTFSGNQATASATGSFSSASAAGGGMYASNGSVLNLFNTIIANSTNGDCDKATITITENNNLIKDSSHACGLLNGTNGDIIGSNPNLGPLANNGGNTQTMALLSGSPAINKGSNSVCTAAPVNNLDQRGIARPQGGTCDIGAYERTVAPTFADVPFSYWAWQHIERLYFDGITGGCSNTPLSYCPGTTVTRDQMAVFLLRGEHGSAYTPPAATGSMFADVPQNYWAAAWIEQLANEGITGGCGSGNYCPSLPVTRDQMAVFLLRGEHGGGYVPPAATGSMFADVPQNYWAAAWIEQLAAEGITGGCGGGNYCPTTPVTRDQMAVFLVRAFSLP